MQGRKLWALLWLLLLGFSWAQQRVPVTFTYDPPYGLEVRSVSLRGSFNNWAELPMQKTEDGVWQVTVELPPGPIQYKFFI
ncbi:MAG: glycogen-binding domain-containing protein, partial [Meiothermus ruber]|nr:glycogen-binding domain-containing protein [Meiothermus ruber]